MPRGFGRGFFWPGYFGFGGFWGRGNPYPFCRFFPWLPRWWWASPYAAQYAATITGQFPFYRPGIIYPYYGW